MSRRIPIREAKPDEPERKPEAVAESEAPAPEAESGSAEAEKKAREENSWRERYLRLQADFQNYRRHAEAEKSRLTELGKEAALVEIFPLVDHLDRGLKWAQEHGAEPAVMEGLQLVQRELCKILEKHGITRLATLGQAFNPEFHEAVSVIAREGATAGEIVEELQPGFLRDGKVLRPARVVVAA